MSKQHGARREGDGCLAEVLGREGCIQETLLFVLALFSSIHISEVTLSPLQRSCSAEKEFWKG